MNFLRTLSLIALSAIIIISGTANAAKSCCCMSTQESASNKTKTNSEMASKNAMPCHDQSADASIKGGSNGNQDDCDKCDCNHCMKISALPTKIPTKAAEVLIIKNFTTNNLHSIFSQGLLQPPKQLLISRV